MIYEQLLESEAFTSLFDENGPMGERLAHLERRIMDTATPLDEVVALRSERAGIMSVYSMVVDLCEKERNERFLREEAEVEGARSSILQKLGARDVFGFSPPDIGESRAFGEV